MKLTITIMALLLLVSSSYAADSILAAIPEGQIEFGCGCNYHLSDKSPYNFILQADFSFRKPMAFIDNKLIELERIMVEDIPKKPKIGDTFTQHYRYNNIDIEFKNTISFVCPLGDESCEVLRFDSILKTTYKGKTATTLALGECGC